LTLSTDINSTIEVNYNRPLDVSLLHQIGGGSNNRDVFKELREDISKVIKEVATEYVALYPAPPTENGESANDMEQRKIHFLHHLTSNGIYHRLKESIKPRIQRAARKRYGVRSRALGLAGSANFDSMAIGSETEVPLDQLVAEFYVFLVQECNFVLNSMYRETVVACDISELEKPPAIDDELESPKQLFKRLLSLAWDAEATKDFGKAEQRHLERIQLLTIEKVFTGDYSSIRNAYSEYAQFLMHRAAYEGRNFESENRDASLALAREALLVALAADTGDAESDWDLQLQLGCLLLEVGQHESAIEYIQLSIEAQVQPTVPLSVDNFDGYESDKICPVFPLCHIFASIYYLEQNKPLTARKATRLAVRSYAESNAYPSYETHGKPKRTATVAYTMASLYAFARGFSRVGKICFKWAKECDDAATQKADARNMPTNAAPVVRFLTKKAECTSLLDSRNFEAAIQAGRDCVNAAPDSYCQVEGHICLLKALVESGADSKEMYDSFMQALQAAAVHTNSDNDHYRALPLWVYIEVGKSLMAVGNYSEAVKLMLLGCSVYVSSTLFLMIGISCLRLERFQDAEDALEEANMIDNRNAQVWGYLTILCMSGGDSRRLHEGNRCLQQVLRLGLTGPEAPGLLREMAMSQIAVDRLNAAEDLLRRAISLETQMNPSGKANPHTRKMLADVLMGQNSLVVAVEEYQRVIEDAEADLLTRFDACDKCISVLASLGRDEEIRSVSLIQDALRSGGR
jgi:tetratricopeptide (TPR) repeat protein